MRVTQDNALNITPRISINDAVGPKAGHWSGAQPRRPNCGTRRAAVVAVTNGWLDGST
jgi:hypothetical protein